IISSIIRADYGTEYTLMAPVHMFFREKHNDIRANLLSWKYGSSTSNQRIEAWWSHLKKYKSQFWIELFTEIEIAGEWYYGNYID
ncbi:12181_t:CDS:1, partial [Racocetra persica]